MIFNQPEKPGTYSRFDFPNLPAPLNGIVAILRNNDMLSWSEKIELAKGLVPAMLRGQKYVDSTDRLTFSEWLKQQGVGDDVEQGIFIAAAKSLNFIDPDEISALVLLTALNKFLQQKNGSQVAFLDGSPTERLCQPIVDHITKRGGKVELNAPLKEILLNENGSVKGFLIRGQNGAADEIITADLYVSAMPVDVMKVMLPKPWQQNEFFQKLDGLEGVPVINIHLWFDRKLTDIDNLLFSRSRLLSVYADMSNTCKEYANPDRSMLEFVFAPAKDWIDKSEEEILKATLIELETLFPQHFGGENPAKLLKHIVVKTPRSVYKATPGCQEYRPTQVTPVSNFYLAGSYTMQPFLGSMEGAVLSGKLTAQAITAQATLEAKSSSKPTSTLQPATNAATA